MYVHVYTHTKIMYMHYTLCCTWVGYSYLRCRVDAAYCCVCCGSAQPGLIVGKWAVLAVYCLIYRHVVSLLPWINHPLHVLIENIDSLHSISRRYLFWEASFRPWINHPLPLCSQMAWTQSVGDTTKQKFLLIFFVTVRVAPLLPWINHPLHNNMLNNKHR